MTPRESERLRWELTAILAAEDDMHMITICGPCGAGIKGANSDARTRLWPEEPPSHLIV